MAAATKTKNLYSALISAYAEMPELIKDSNNPHFKSSFSSLPNVIETVTSALHNNGIVLAQVGDFHENGSPVMRTILRHVETGEELVSTLPLVSKDPSNPQAFGSSITYMRRYALLAILNLAALDDDGETATGRGANVPTAESVVMIKTLAKNVRGATGKEAIDEISRELLGKNLEALTKKDADNLVKKLNDEKQAREGAF